MSADFASVGLTRLREKYLQIGRWVAEAPEGRIQYYYLVIYDLPLIL